MVLARKICNLISKQSITKKVTFMTASSFLQMACKHRRNALLKVSFSFSPETKKEIKLSSTESADLTAQQANADKITIFTSSFPAS